MHLFSKQWNTSKKQGELMVKANKQTNKEEGVFLCPKLRAQW